MMENRRLKRSNKSRIISGVAAGIAEYINIDPVIIRILFVFLTFVGGSGAILYLILLFIMPDEKSLADNSGKYDNKSNYIVDEQGNVEPENPADEVKSEESHSAVNEPVDQTDATDCKKDRNIVLPTLFGVLLIGTGLFILFSKIFSFCWTHYLFPLLLVVCGIILIIFSGKRKK